jgi:hypothetical protein
MRSRRAVLLLAAMLPLLAPMRGAAAPPSPDYELMFEDNFDGDRLDTSVWNHRTGRRTGMGIDGMNLAANVSVSNGLLHVAARHEEFEGKMENTGGGVISKRQFGYGYYECRSRPFMDGHGVHTSFWQAGNLFEIDGYEIDSGSWMACNNLYVRTAPKPFKEVPWPLRAHIPWRFGEDGWFLDGYEYTPDGVIFYDNSKEVARVDWPDFPAAQVVWLTALNGVGRVDTKKLPGVSTFDYFRYYAKDFPGRNILPNGGFEYNQDRIDAAKPLAWRVEGDPAACRVTTGDDGREGHRLRLGRDGKAWEVRLSQRLEFIRNGDYHLRAVVRSSAALDAASVLVNGNGPAELAVNLPVTSAWSRVTQRGVQVASNTVTVVLSARGAAGQWVELDDVELYKPLPSGEAPPAPKLYRPVGDPIWSLARNAPLVLKGDSTFYFFDRTVGIGPAVTVLFTARPDKRAGMSPIARLPRQGRTGWSVQFQQDGRLAFRLGSAELFRDVVTPPVWTVSREIRVACVFDRGTVSIYVDGRRVARETGLPLEITDETAPGRVGNVSEVYEAVGEVIMATGPKPPRRKFQSFTGTLRNIAVHHRALTEAELK